jgi:hypothetical protein
LYPFPIFSITFGYMSIAQRSIIQLVKGLDETPAALSSSVAGPSLWFMLGMIPVYWGLVVMFEYKCFDCKGKKRDSADVSASMRKSQFKAH